MPLRAIMPKMIMLRCRRDERLRLHVTIYCFRHFEPHLRFYGAYYAAIYAKTATAMLC